MMRKTAKTPIIIRNLAAHHGTVTCQIGSTMPLIVPAGFPSARMSGGRNGPWSSITLEFDIPWWLIWPQLQLLWLWSSESRGGGSKGPDPATQCSGSTVPTSDPRIDCMPRRVRGLRSAASVGSASSNCSNSIPPLAILSSLAVHASQKSRATTSRESSVQSREPAIRRQSFEISHLSFEIRTSTHRAQHVSASSRGPKFIPTRR